MTSFVWDMDGTLLNSYDSIIDRIEKTLEDYHLSYPHDFIKDYILSSSTGDFFKMVQKEHSMEDDLFEYYRNLPVDLKEITLMPYAKEVLDCLNEHKIQNYVFTHRGKNLYEILKNNDIASSFVDIVDGESGFQRKPSPQAINYLVDKYHLERNDTYYIGDRQIDGECARNGHIGMIFYQSYKKTVMNPSLFDYQITDLRQLYSIFKI